jgi:hypothetical protein
MATYEALEMAGYSQTTASGLAHTSARQLTIGENQMLAKISTCIMCRVGCEHLAQVA